MKLPVHWLAHGLLQKYGPICHNMQRNTGMTVLQPHTTIFISLEKYVKNNNYGINFRFFCKNLTQKKMSNFS